MEILNWSRTPSLYVGACGGILTHTREQGPITPASAKGQGLGPTQNQIAATTTARARLGHMWQVGALSHRAMQG